MEDDDSPELQYVTGTGILDPCSSSFFHLRAIYSMSLACQAESCRKILQRDSSPKINFTHISPTYCSMSTVSLPRSIAR